MIWCISPDTEPREWAQWICQMRGEPVLLAFDVPSAWALLRTPSTPEIILAPGSHLSTGWERWRSHCQKRYPHAQWFAPGPWTEWQLRQVEIEVQRLSTRKSLHSLA